MSSENFIPLRQLCTHYKVEMSFFTHLNEFGLIQIETIEESLCIHQDKITDVEKMVRLHLDLDLNFEGIDTVFNLLEKISDLQAELTATKNRLRLYED
ncbi:chaperone modulator CbpM [Roseivirga echinicomitans]